MKEAIEIHGARHHNLKDLSVAVPRHAFVVITGVSGSGKSTLAFDIIFAEGQRRYIESLPTYIRQFLKLYEQPDVDLISGLPPTVAIEQRLSQAGPRSTVGTLTEIYHFLRLLYAKVGTPHCPECDRPLSRTDEETLLELLQEKFSGQKVLFLAPKVKRRKGYYRPLFERALKAGRKLVRIDGRLVTLPPVPELSRYKEHTIEIAVGEETVTRKTLPRIKELLRETLAEGKEEAVLLV
ncbi:MAG TPA: excinuclease ABC subunit A, partial [Thermodesulfatator atlanticus]|nr:excinuclease ABC subunit A [Thermodesulfatator atlanticus]